MSNKFQIIYQSIKVGETLHILNLHDWAEKQLNYKDFCEFYEAMKRHDTLVNTYLKNGIIIEKKFLQQKLIQTGFDWEKNITRDREVLYNTGIEYIFSDNTNPNEIDLDKKFKDFLNLYDQTAKKTLAKIVLKKN